MTSAWDRYVTDRAASAFAWGAFELTSWPPSLHFPGVEILEPGPGMRVLDIGCGDGDNAAHLAGLGPQVTAVDQSPVRVAAARQRWGQVANLTVVQAEAVEFLTAAGPVFDAIYSVYGAAWFTDPELLVPAAFAALRPGGLFLCSHADMDPPRGRVTLDSAPDIHRWDLSPRSWRMLLRANGFREVGMTLLPPTRGFANTFTVLVGGRRASGENDTDD